MLKHLLFISALSLFINPVCVFGQSGASESVLKPASESVGLEKKGDQKEEEESAIDLTGTDLNSEGVQWESVKGSSAIGSISVDEILKPTVEYSYSSFGYQDPFKEADLSIKGDEDTDSMAEQNVKNSEIPMVSALQAYPIEKLKVKGVWVSSDGNISAIVATPKNEGVIVKKGDPIAAGLILSISKTSLVTRQYRLRKDGVRIYKDVSLPIGPKIAEEKGVVILAPGEQPKFKESGEAEVEE